MQFQNENLYACERMPPEAHDGPSWDIMRSPDKGNFLFACVSHDFWGLRTHWMYGRNVACLKSGCEGCKDGRERRWHGYVLGVMCKTEQRIIFEFTPPGSLVLDAHFKNHGTLRGLTIRAGRARDHKRAKVALQIMGVNKGAHQLPTDERIWPTLAKIYHLSVDCMPSVCLPATAAQTEHELAMTVDLPPLSGIDDDWIKARAMDLAGQLVLPLGTNPSANGNQNGRSRH